MAGLLTGASGESMRDREPLFNSNEIAHSRIYACINEMLRSHDYVLIFCKFVSSFLF